MGISAHEDLYTSVYGSTLVAKRGRYLEIGTSFHDNDDKVGNWIRIRESQSVFAE